jgi:hypothetical protein
VRLARNPQVLDSFSSAREEKRKRVIFSGLWTAGSARLRSNRARAASVSGSVGATNGVNTLSMIRGACGLLHGADRRL